MKQIEISHGKIRDRRQEEIYYTFDLGALVAAVRAIGKASPEAETRRAIQTWFFREERTLREGGYKAHPEVNEDSIQAAIFESAEGRHLKRGTR